MHRDLKEGLADILRWLHGVEEIYLTSQVFRRVQLHRNNHYYGFLMNVCEVIYENLLVDERTGKSRFRDFLRDEQAMPRLFEAFVRNFYRVEQKEFQVSSLKIQWQVTNADETVRQYLPEMRTDVCLQRTGRMIVLDSKFYKEALQSYYGKPTINSSHLYQLHAYLRNLEDEVNGKQCEGILLYPAVNYPLDLAFDVQGHPVRIKTINLDQDWQLIKRDLLEIIQARNAGQEISG